MKRIVKVVAVLLAFALIYAATDSVLRMKKSERNLGTLKQYYDLPQDTVDVLFVGSSHIGLNIDPSLLMEEYGIASYALWSGMQPVWNSYYYVKEALRTQNPKVVVVELFLCGSDFEYSSNIEALMGLLPMRMGFNKIGLAFSNFEKWQDAVEALWGMPIYHTRYEELTDTDYLYYATKDNGIQQAPHNNTFAFPLNLLDYNKITENVPLGAKNEDYLRKIINLCKIKKIDCVLLIAPYQATKEEAMHFNSVESIAAEEDVLCLNHLKTYKEIGIDQTTDFLDITGHLNATAIPKYTRILGNALKENFNLPDRRLDKAHIWNSQTDLKEMKALYRLEKVFLGDGNERYVDTGVKLYENPLSTWTLQTRLNMQDFGNGEICLSCYSGEEGRDGLGFFLRKENDGTLLLKLGAERNWYLNYTGSEIDFSLVKQSSTYTAYVNGEVVLQNEKFSCDPHEGALLIGCQERLPGGERYNFSHGHVLNLEIYERALDAQTIADWSPEALPEPQLPLGLLVEKPEPVYTLPEQFLGGGEGYDQGAYMDTDLRLLDEAGTRFTLLASVTPEHIDGDKVFFSCFSEEADHYRGILARQWDDESMNVVVGANYGVNIPIKMGQPVKLAIIKDGSTYTVYADGEKLLDHVESQADAYDGTLLIGAQRDAEGNVFRMSRTRVNSLTVMSGVMDEADILAYDFADAPEPAKIIPTSVSYRMPTAFAGNGKSNSLDTGVMLYDVPAKDWTLQATVRTRQGTNAGVYFSCFSESGSYRGLMLRQNDENTISLFMGELATHTFDLTDQNRTLNLVVVKQGDTYRVYANGAFCEEIEIPCTRYTGTLLVGCQADAEGELFRFSNARVDALELWDGAMDEEEALKRSAQQGAGSRFD